MFVFQTVLKTEQQTKQQKSDVLKKVPVLTEQAKQDQQKKNRLLEAVTSNLAKKPVTEWSEGKNSDVDKYRTLLSLLQTELGKYRPKAGEETLKTQYTLQLWGDVKRLNENLSRETVGTPDFPLVKTTNGYDLILTPAMSQGYVSAEKISFTFVGDKPFVTSLNPPNVK